MPKIKTNSGSKKRFVLTRTGKIKESRFSQSYFLIQKTKNKKKPCTLRSSS